MTKNFASGNLGNLVKTTSFHFGLFIPCMSLPNAGVIAESVGVRSVLPVDLEGESLGILVRLLKRNKRRHYRLPLQKSIETGKKSCWWENRLTQISVQFRTKKSCYKYRIWADICESWRKSLVSNLTIIYSRKRIQLHLQITGSLFSSCRQKSQYHS
jgi:hypothetical protein